jgi:hypothetical protein
LKKKIIIWFEIETLIFFFLILYEFIFITTNLQIREEPTTCITHGKEQNSTRFEFISVWYVYLLHICLYVGCWYASFMWYFCKFWVFFISLLRSFVLYFSFILFEPKQSFEIKKRANILLFDFDFYLISFRFVLEIKK